MGVLSRKRFTVAVADINAAPYEFDVPNGSGELQLIVVPLDENGDAIDPDGSTVTGTLSVDVVPSGGRFFQSVLNEADDTPLAITVSEVGIYPFTISVAKMRLTAGVAIANCSSIEVTVNYIG